MCPSRSVHRGVPAFQDFEAVPPDVLAANLRRAERKFDLVERSCGHHAGVLDGFTACGDDDDLAADQLHELAERASVQGLRIAYEALAWGRFVNTHTPGTS